MEKLARYENKLSHIRAFDTRDLLWWQQATLRSAESLLILYKRLLFIICWPAWELQQAGSNMAGVLSVELHNKARFRKYCWSEPLK